VTKTFFALNIFLDTAETRLLEALFELILMFLNYTTHSQRTFFYLSFHRFSIIFWFFSKVLFAFAKHSIFVVNKPENHEFMQSFSWIFWSYNNVCLLLYEFISKYALIPFFCSGSASASPFYCFIFPMFIRICMSIIWMRKSGFLNHPILLFPNIKAIKLVLQLSTYLLFIAIINNRPSEWPNFGTVWYILRKTKKFTERKLINTLFLKSKVGKIMLLL
jgi:hypothetical protein